MSVLIFAEHKNGKVVKASLGALAFGKEVAAKLGTGYNLVVAGSGIGDVAESLKAYGAEKVYVADAPELGNIVAEAYTEVVAAAAKESGATMVVGVANSTGKAVMPRVAARLDAGMASDIIGWDADAMTFDRPIYAGNVISTLKIDTDVKVVTVRGTAFEPAEAGAAGGETAALAVDLGAALAKTKFVAMHASNSARPELTEASVVISGGRGLKDIGGFEQYIYPLADLLNAAVGTTRAVVDAGILPNDLQVGQTGQIVAPDLYFAVGISGAIQHLAGMKDSKVIVAINKDDEAPIFNVADYGLVADATKVMPELVEKVSAAKSN